MIRIIALVGFFMVSIFFGPGLDVESGKGVIIPIWNFSESPGYLATQMEENWFSRGRAFWGYGLWFFNVMAHFFMLLVLNRLLERFFAQAAGNYRGNGTKAFIQGLIYLIGIPMLVVYCLATILSIPFGLLLLVVYLLSIWLGDCLAALLLCHLLNSRNERSWNFWTIVMLSLGIVIAIDLLIFFPVLGILIYIVILAFTYGIFFNLVKQTYPNLNFLNRKL